MVLTMKTRKPKKPQEEKLHDKKGVTEKVGVYLFDIDGCLFHNVSKTGYQNIQDWLIRENQKLINKIIEEIHTKSYTKVIIGFFTNRQDFNTDLFNGFRRNSGTCTLVLPILQSYIQTQLIKNNFPCKTKVVLDPFWTADIFANPKNGGEMKAGGSYKLALSLYRKTTSEMRKDIESREIPKTLFDQTKTTLMYAHAHRAAHLNPNATIEIRIIEDDEDILYHIKKFINQRPDFFPVCNINITMYNGREIRDKFTLKGTGKIDPQYDWNIRHAWSRQNAEEIKSIGELKKAHLNNAYYNVDSEEMPKITMAVFYNYKNKVFTNFCTQESIKEPSTLGDESNYTTAEELLKEALIPRSAVVTPGDITIYKQKEVFFKPKSKEEASSKFPCLVL